MEVGIFDEQALGGSGGVEFLIGRNQGERREATGGAAGLEFQGRSELHRVIGAEPVRLGERHGMGQQGWRDLDDAVRGQVLAKLRQDASRGGG